MTTVSIAGIRGSYSEEAAVKMLGASVGLVECFGFGDALEMVLKMRSVYALLPVRNTIVGEIDNVSELIGNSGLGVLDEFALEIDHVLAGTQISSIGDITRVCSHPAALGQCSLFLAAMPQVTIVETSDTASSVRGVVAGNNNHNAAISSRRAARIYNAKIICESIANETNNRTTFALIGNIL